MRRLAGCVAVSATALTILAAPTLAQPSCPPLDQPEPPLSVPIAQLRAALQCQPGVAHAKVEPVLLNPATGVTPVENYSWNWEPALDRLGIPWCTYSRAAAICSTVWRLVALSSGMASWEHVEAGIRAGSAGPG